MRLSGPCGVLALTLSAALVVQATAAPVAPAAPAHGSKPAPRSGIAYSDSAQVWFADGSTAQFIPNGAGYLTPAGLDADLTHNGDGTWTVAVHASAEKLDFDSSGKLIGDTDRNGNKITYTYTTCNGNSLVASITGTRGDAGGRTISIGYDAGCNRTSVTQTASAAAGGATRSVGITQVNSQETGATDAAGGQYSYGYDSAHNLTSITTPDGHSLTIGYDASHRVTTLTQDPSGLDAVTTFSYVTGGETDVTDPNGHTTKYSYDAYRRVTSVLDANGNKQSASFTGDNKVSSFSNASGGTTGLTYGANSNESLTNVAGPLGAASSMTYTNTSPSTKYLPTSSIDSTNTKTTYGYDGPGNQTSSTDAAADQVYSHYNSAGSGQFPQYPGTLDFTTEPANKGRGNSTPANCTRPSSDGGGVDNCTAYQYDSGGDLAAVIPPDGNSLTTQHFTYDGFGRRLTATDGRGVTTTYSYDNLDHIAGLSYSDATPAISYTYNGDGTLATRTDTSGTTSYGYDTLDRLTAKASTGTTSYTLGYTFDNVGNLTSLTDSRGTTSYAYDPVNNLTKLTEGASSHVDVFRYNKDNQRTDTWDAATGYVLDSNNVVTTVPTGFAAHLNSGFDAANRLTTLTTSRAGDDTNLVDNLSYSYKNGAGTDTNSRQSVTDGLAGQTTTYAYDGTGRLHEAATNNGGPVYDYCYDPNGDITVAATAATTCATATPTHSYNSADQLTDTGVSYDADGELSASPGSNPALSGLGYNGAGQTTSITPSGTSADTFGYAGPDQAERVSQSRATHANPAPVSYVNGLTGVQSQTVSGSTSYDERDPNGTLIAAVTGNTETYFYFDAVGSVLGLIGATSKQLATYSYDPYGGHMTVGQAEATGTTTANNNPWRYASGQYDPSTGLYRFGVRYYDPTLARFTQPDPQQHLLDLRQGNPYAYAGDDPINNTDPTGQFAIYFNYANTVDLAYGLSALGGILGVTLGIFATPVAGLLAGGAVELAGLALQDAVFGHNECVKIQVDTFFGVPYAAYPELYSPCAKSTYVDW